MKRNSPPLWRPVVLLFAALLCLLAAGALRARHNYLARGIPASLPEPINHGGAAIGVNVHLLGLDDPALADTLQQIAASGIRLIKQPFYFTNAQSFDWSESDRIVRAAGAHGLQLAVLLDGDPTDDFKPPAEPALFAHWAGEFAQRYGPSIRTYFIWDEPNLTTHWGMLPVNAADYAALLAASAGAIRANDPDAIIVAAPLAPTTERGPQNLSDVLYLEELYATGAAGFFDAVAAKPYGFSSSPEDRTVAPETLNFSRAILLREVMQRHDDDQKAIFAGNWGWNSLPQGWQGDPSIWGRVDAQQRVAYTSAAFWRARTEWPWMGLMFLEVWRAPEPDEHPRHGFNIAGSPLETALGELAAPPELAFPGFHLAAEDGAGQQYAGRWRFSPQFGADISQTGDAATFHFWGSDVGLRVRRADYRARLYVTIDGEPAQELPHDGSGAALVLTSPAQEEDYLQIVPVARGLGPGPHVMTVEAYRGWEAWALNGFSVGYAPPGLLAGPSRALSWLGGLLLLVVALIDLRHAHRAGAHRASLPGLRKLRESSRLMLTLGAALLVAVTGWLTWGEQAAGIYRRLGDGGQLALTAAAASIFYVTPAFFVYLAALAILFLLLAARPAWGLALVALFFPFYVLPKPMLGYRFSPVELFVLLTAAATILHGLWRLRAELARLLDAKESVAGYLSGQLARLKSGLLAADYAALFFLLVATLSLLFTERLDVAENEWRVVIVEPVLFYFLVRAIRPTSKEMWTVVDAFVLGGVVVSLYGLWRYVWGGNVITVAEGLTRLHSIYGSPNNVALYLGRILPFLFALALMGNRTPLRRRLYAVAFVPVALSLVLSLSKGGLFLGAPFGLGIVFLLWLRETRRAIWPWLLAALFIAVSLVASIALVPGLATRLDLRGTTSILRLSLWQASLNMFIENPFFGVGLDNFLYEYRGRYILDSGWEEPDLSHPHNIFLDFATRLGIMGLLAGAWLLTTLLRNLWRLPERLNREWRPLAIAASGATAQMVAHGLVDHSFFLVDLAFVFFLLLSLSVWLRNNQSVTNGRDEG